MTGEDLVRKEGLEPTRLSAPEPKSGASTNFATFAPQRLIKAALGTISLQLPLPQGS